MNVKGSPRTPPRISLGHPSLPHHFEDPNSSDSTEKSGGGTPGISQESPGINLEAWPPPFGRLWDWSRTCIFPGFGFLCFGLEKNMAQSGLQFSVLLKIPISHPSFMSLKVFLYLCKTFWMFPGTSDCHTLHSWNSYPQKNIFGKKMNHSKFVIWNQLSGLHRWSQGVKRLAAPGRWFLPPGNSSSVDPSVAFEPPLPTWITKLNRNTVSII